MAGFELGTGTELWIGMVMVLLGGELKSIGKIDVETGWFV